jgi:iron-sulfur cluster assembly protein
MITLTESAAKQIKEQFINLINPCLRVGLKTGCAGYSYVMLFEEYSFNLKKDSEFESQGIKIIVDNRSLSLLDGCIIDFERKLLDSKFVFNNPNSKQNCGCGNSFEKV